MKKRVCVINTVTWLRAPISEWIDNDIEVTLISSYDVEKIFLNQISDYIFFKQYDNDQALENLVIELHQEKKFDVLIALSERDVLRVAKLRELLGIDGQKYFSALLYRDKYLMKQFAKLNNLHVPEFGKFHNFDDLVYEISKIGYPVLVKPLSESGSEGVHILRNKEDLDTYANQGFSTSNEYDVERFISGDMYHVDGIVENGKLGFVSVSKYWNSLGQSTTLMCGNIDRTVTFADFTIDYSDWEFSMLKTEVLKFIRRSGLYNGTIHAEFIISDKDKTPYFIEIASRTGGLMITNTLEKKYGIIMNKVSFDLQVGRKVKYPLKRESKNFGFLTIFPQNKKLIDFNIENIKSDPNVIKFFEHHKIGKTYNISEYMNHIGVLIFDGTSQEDMKHKIQYLTTLIDSNITWK